MNVATPETQEQPDHKRSHTRDEKDKMLHTINAVNETVAFNKQGRLIVVRRRLKIGFLSLSVVIFPKTSWMANHAFKVSAAVSVENLKEKRE